jgi:hypothetical protein
MNVKNFIIGGIVGGIVDFLMGWLLYGMLLKDTFPTDGKENLLFIFLGCLCFGFLISYVFSLGEGVTKCVPGIKTALVIGFFMSLSNNFFRNMTSETIDLKFMAIDVLAALAISAMVGAVVAVVNGKMK